MLGMTRECVLGGVKWRGGLERGIIDYRVRMARSLL
jgi:hypothetical protein